MAVEITNKCDRCNRSESLHVSHDELMEHIEEQKAVASTVEQITSVVREIWDTDPTHFPAIMTIHVKDGHLVIQDKVSLCGPDENRKRGGHGCEVRVSQLVDEIHLDKKKE
jgi:16S rRNA C967 or C1407 C5-methylase (RsmB/RsmF family)